MPTCLSKYILHDCCDVGHAWQDNCLIACFVALVSSFRYSLQLYTPLYVASALLTGKRKKYFIKKLYIEILRSCAFLSGNTVFMLLLFCFFRKCFGCFYPLTVGVIPGLFSSFCAISIERKSRRPALAVKCFGCFYPLTVGVIPGLFSSFCAISIERKSRRPALAVYMLNQAFDTTFNMLKSAGLAKDIKYGEVMIFSVSMAILTYLYRTKSLPNGFVKSLFDYFLKRKKVSRNEGEQTDSIQIISSEVNHNEKLNAKESLLMSCKAFGIGYGIQTSYYFLTSLPNLISKPENLLKAFLKKNSFQLAAFLGSLVALYRYTEELLSNFSKSHLNAFIAGGVAGCSMLFQRSSYIALYVLSKTCELVYMSGIEKGYLPYIKHFDTVLYTICTSIMLNAAIMQPLYLRPTYWQFLDRLTNKRFRLVKRSAFNSFGLDSDRIDKLGLVDPALLTKYVSLKPL